MKTARKTAKADPNDLATRLRDIIRGRRLTAYAVARDAGMDPGMVQRFLTGERDLRLESAAKICTALGLRLVEAGRGRNRPQADNPPPSPCN
jgi:transcriptional regulator with XRE-family HTH domain